MNQLQELRLHAEALLVAVEQAPSFFASINRYATRLHDILGNDAANLSQEELTVIARKIEEFFSKWRGASGSLYIPPRETADADGTVQDIKRIVADVVALPHEQFRQLVEYQVALDRSRLKVTRGGSTRVEDHGVIAAFKRHWLVSLIGLCAAVSVATWTLALNVLVAPRDFEITRLRRERDEPRSRPEADHTGSTPLVLQELSVMEGNSVTTSDGACAIKVLQVRGNEVTFGISAGSDTAQRVLTVSAGGRGTIRGAMGLYYLDLHRIRGNIVDMSVIKK